MSNKLKLQDDSKCFVCGKENPFGLRLTFNNKDGKIISEFTPSETHQGYRDITHGGIISSVLDDAMVYAAVEEGIFPITAEITVRFKKPLTTGDTAIIEAEAIKRTSRLVITHAKLIRKKDGSLIAEASGKIAKRAK